DAGDTRLARSGCRAHGDSRFRAGEVLADLGVPGLALPRLAFPRLRGPSSGVPRPGVPPPGPFPGVGVAPRGRLLVLDAGGFRLGALTGLIGLGQTADVRWVRRSRRVLVICAE